MIISILNQKGGCGKTTIAINLAHWFQLQNQSVLLVDSDEQGSARKWHNTNDASVLDLITLDQPTIDKDIKKLNLDYQYIFIDGVPQTSIMAIRSVKVSDVVLIPVQPSDFDYWATAETVQIVKERQESNDDLLAALIISRNISNSKLIHRIKDQLNEFELPIFNNFTNQRVIYIESAQYGQTVFHHKNKEAKQEIESIGNELLELINHENMLRVCHGN